MGAIQAAEETQEGVLPADAELPEDTNVTVDTEPVEGEVLDDSEAAPGEATGNVTAALPSSVTAAIRTATPMLVGLVVTLAVRLGIPMSQQYQDLLTTGLPVVLAYVYWLVARQLEKRWPDVPWLGSTRKPVYTPPGVQALAASSLAEYKGGRFTPAAASSIRELDRLTPHIPVYIVKGGWVADSGLSADTHARDAVDISVRGLSRDQIATLVTLLRMLGWAAWYRQPGWDGVNPGNAHIHAVPNGWGQLSNGAEGQVRQYRNGTNGLRSHGSDNQLGATSKYRMRTWQGYLAQHEKQVSASSSPKRVAHPISWSNYQRGVQSGAFNGNVRVVQLLLSRQKRNGVAFYPGHADGIAGPMTRRAIKDWQVAIGDVGDGELGIKQFTKLVAWGGYTAVA